MNDGQAGQRPADRGTADRGTEGPGWIVHGQPPAPSAQPPPAHTDRWLFGRGPWGQVRRPSQGRELAGVAAALAGKFGVTPLAARLALGALSFFGGAGIFLYVGGWLVLPPEGTDEAVAQVALADRRTVGLVAASVSALGALMLAAAALGPPSWLGALSPGVVSLGALVAIWRHAGEEDRVAAQRMARLVTGSGPGAAPTRRRVVMAVSRLLAGAGLVALGTSTLVAPRHLNDADISAALAAVGVVAGFSLVLAPWWLRLGRELVAERRERARAEERAEMAAHLHDSVLQTLALIQRSADDQHQVKRLARAQERQLRSWLFDGKAPGETGEGEPARLAAALMAVQQGVEEVHGVRVEVVTVGDTCLDDRSRALVAATREAVVNAAKWSGADVVAVYAEVETDAVSVFVRDRGRGFDPAAVAPDRRGISESVHARIERHGGISLVRSSPGQGTEVELKMPRRPQP
jgi:signal transduction histidine kinase